MIIQHNLLSLNAQNKLKSNQKEKTNVIEKLSSGYQINRAADDAAGLAISEKMRGQIKGLERAAQNSQDGISLIQTAEGGMAEIHSMLQRIRELTVQAYNDTNVTEDKEAIQREIDHLRTEIDRCSYETEFNTIKVLKGQSEVVNYVEGGKIPGWVGMDPGASLQLPNAGVTSTTTVPSKTYQTDSGPKTTDTNLANNASTYIEFRNLGNPPGMVANLQSLIGTGFSSTCCTCSTQYSICFTDASGINGDIAGYPTPIDISDLIADAQAGIKTSSQIAADLVQKIVTVGNAMYNHFTNYAVDGGDPTKLVIFDYRDDMTPASSSYGKVIDHLTYKVRAKDIILQIGANRDQSMEIILPQITLEKLHLQFGYDKYYGVIGSTRIEYYYSSYEIKYLPNGEMYSVGIGPRKERIIKTETTGTLDDIDYAIDYVSRERSRMGAYQNRLEHVYNNNLNASENLQEAESKIRDADMAELMVLFATHDILSQAGEAMLAQANRNPEKVIELLEGL